MRSHDNEHQPMSIPILEPCLDCQICPFAKDESTGTNIHLGDLGTQFNWTPWNVAKTRRMETRTGLKIRLSVASQSNLEALLASPAVFLEDQGPGLKELLTEFTGDHERSYPYVCIATIDQKIVAKLYLDPNWFNSMRPNLHAAIVDSVQVDKDYRDKGIGDCLLEFAEDVARDNGIQWLEIGVVKNNPAPLSSYLRRGFREHALYMRNEFQIHYQVQGVPGSATMVCPRYKDGAVLVYKNLNAKVETINHKQLYEQLIAGIP
jgi:GNAT superfamily N-acetyltransferase